MFNIGLQAGTLASSLTTNLDYFEVFLPIVELPVRRSIEAQIQLSLTIHGGHQGYYRWSQPRPGPLSISPKSGRYPPLWIPTGPNGPKGAARPCEIGPKNPAEISGGVKGPVGFCETDVESPAETPGGAKGSVGSCETCPKSPAEESDGMGTRMIWQNRQMRMEMGFHYYLLRRSDKRVWDGAGVMRA